MARAIILILVFASALNLKAQRIQEIAKLSIDSSSTEIEILMKNEIPDHVKLVGIGDVATWVKETQKFNTGLSAFLISKRSFKNLIFPADEWQIRPVNSYLRSASPIDTAVLDSLLKNYLPDNSYQSFEFRSFMFWLKKHNLSNPKNMVNVFGVQSTETIPHSYFLAAYIYPVDKVSGAKLANKWDDFVFNHVDAYKDIEEWCLRMKQSNLSKEQKEMVKQCEMDLAHNKSMLKVESMTQKFPVEVVNNYTSYTAKKILEITTEKSIFFAPNSSVARSNFRSSRLIDDAAVTTVGKLLQLQLKEDYYVCVSDAATIRLPLADLATQSITIDTLSGSEQIKNMLSQKDIYFRRSDKQLLQKFLPLTIGFIKGYNTTMVLDEGMAPADAVFIFKNVTEDLPFAMK